MKDLHKITIFILRGECIMERKEELDVFKMDELEELEDMVCLGSGGSAFCCNGGNGTGDLEVGKDASALETLKDTAALETFKEVAP